MQLMYVPEVSIKGGWGRGGVLLLGDKGQRIGAHSCCPRQNVEASVTYCLTATSQ